MNFREKWGLLVCSGWLSSVIIFDYCVIEFDD